LGEGEQFASPLLKERGLGGEDRRIKFLIVGLG
jgi:hypothetical protein